MSSPFFRTLATTIGGLRTLPETGDLSMDIEAKEFSPAASTEADAALCFLASEGTAAFTEIDEEKLVRKIDWMIVPLMWAIYFLQYQDKILINYASVMGLLKDTGMQTDQFSKLALAFYVSYLFFEFPTGYLMQRLPIAKYLGLNVTLWGLLTTLNYAAQNYAGLIVLRVLLGCFESAVAPALILITSMWYKRNEQPKRIGFWYLGTGTATIVGALVAYGLLFYTGDRFRSWQIMFLIFGLITIAVGICVMIFLPDNPMASRLTHEEKLLAIERLRENRTGIENKHFKMYQFVEVFKDPQTYFIAVIVTAMNISNAAISSFSALIIKSFGYTTKETELLTIPGGVVSVISILTGTYLAGRFDQRCLSLIGILACGLLGGCLMAFSHDGMKAAELAGNYLTNCVGAALPLMYSIAGANVAGHTKKVTMNAIVLMSFCLGNILDSIVATVSVAIVFSVLLKCYYIYENRRRDMKGEGQRLENSDFLDLTDRENPEFRVSLPRLRYSMF
ncbi:putative MFS transporter [Aspergillus fischeri NRRL 181]|uniref:Allantoate permease n=1 Tax=Neosartorya fischeri (strain ATCC 1020 / DSM 3700 / CBS 544.65 / FGSC A1164 / JCM 1740 / NRRL 181 / WB 181) TaxID=331117 RepID=A1DFI7_NEOFI|nr:allantoate permease [Aspergillus fischeri NRRL 181]EAW18144.1 allantoate permease [Aspergillus fischeri NRRL 181]